MFKKISKLYWLYFKSAEEYARHIGVTIGKNCLIATHNWSTEPYLITIGNNVQVTQDVYFHTHGGSHAARRIYPKFDVFGKIKVEDNVYIGSGSHIMPGVTIGSGSLVAAGSIVSKSVKPNMLVGGVPAREICTVTEYIAKNLQYNLDTFLLSHDEKKKYLLSLSSDKFITK